MQTVFQDRRRSQRRQWRGAPHGHEAPARPACAPRLAWRLGRPLRAMVAANAWLEQTGYSLGVEHTCIFYFLPLLLASAPPRHAQISPTELSEMSGVVVRCQWGQRGVGSARAWLAARGRGGVARYAPRAADREGCRGMPPDLPPSRHASASPHSAPPPPPPPAHPSALPPCSAPPRRPLARRPRRSRSRLTCPSRWRTRCWPRRTS
jgi:hypothetical protein